MCVWIKLTTPWLAPHVESSQIKATTPSEKRYKSGHWGCTFSKGKLLCPKDTYCYLSGILAPKMYILVPKMDIFAPEMYTLTLKMYIST